MKPLSILLSCFDGDRFVNDYTRYLVESGIADNNILIAVDFPFSHSDPAQVRKALLTVPNVKYVCINTPMSLYDAWNIAIEKAETTFIANLNLDDRVTSDYYQYGVDVLEETSSDVFSSAAITVPEVGQKSKSSKLQQHLPSDRFINRIAKYDLTDLVTVSGGVIRKNCIPHCAPIWRRALHDDHGYFDSRSFDFVGDYEFWLRVAAQGAKFVLSQKPMTLFYMAPGTASDRLMHKESEMLINRWENTFPPPSYKPSQFGERRDKLHHCLNMNAIFSNKTYYMHLRNEISSETLDKYESTAMPELESSVADFKNLHKNEKCLLLCNGPSLNLVEFDKIDLADYKVFGLNKIFLGMSRLGVNIDYIAAVNENVVRQGAEEFKKLRIPLFVSKRASEGLLSEGHHIVHINTDLPHKHQRFSKDAADYVHEGWTVTHAALQLIFYMGFKDVFIVGMDHRFRQHRLGEENAISTIPGDDVDHFDPSYFGRGQTWNLPDLRNSEISYHAALKAFTDDSRRIFDCTINGACRVFPKLDISFLYKKGLGNYPAYDNKQAADVTVIMPVYNADEFIREALISVLAQGIEKLEIIVVDDESCDDSFVIAAEIAKHDSRVRVTRNKRGKGVSGARNTGLDLALGRYVAFLDADDFLDLGSLRTRLDVCEESQALVAHSCCRLVSQDGSDLGLSIDHAARISYSDMATNRVHLNSILISREIAAEFRFDESLSNGEDWHYFAQIMRAGNVSTYVADAACAYRIHPNSTVVKDPAFHENGVLKVIDWIFDDTTDRRFQKTLRVVGDKRTQIIGRKFNVFVNYFLIASHERLGGLLKDPEFAKHLRHRSKGACLGPFKVALARVFGVSWEQFKLDQHRVKMLRERSRQVGLPSLCPGLATVLDGRVCALPPSLTPRQRENEILLGPFTRSDRKHGDETHWVAQWFSSRPGSERRAMVDVGAHFGTALAPFVKAGWSILAFEPDRQNREKLEAFVAVNGFSDQVCIDKRCVGKEKAKSQPFYSSNVSTGISGLSTFDESHKQSDSVDVVSLSNLIEEKLLPSSIDFLKIDTEGYDLFVLQGVPWDVLKPSVIECEFEDSKTKPLGYDYHEMARYLQEKGYTVYVSEWHPIVRYGIQHQWRQLAKYPCDLADSCGWGNLIAFLDPPEEHKWINIVDSMLKESGGAPVFQSRKVSREAVGDVSASSRVTFNIQPSSSRVDINHIRWRYRSKEDADSIWIASTSTIELKRGAEYCGRLRVTAEGDANLRVSLARHGASEYEGASEIVDLRSGEPTLLSLSHWFRQSHEGVKLQLEVLNQQGTAGSLEIDNIAIGETIASVRKRLGLGALQLCHANKAFRDRDYSTALAISLWLCRKKDHSMYADNAIRAARALGMCWVKDLSQLTWLQ